VKDFNAGDWEMMRFGEMWQIVYQKFEQNKLMRKLLLETDGYMLVEGSAADRVWGVGLTEWDKRISDRLNWGGLNLSGQVLVSVRNAMMRDDRADMHLLKRPFPLA